MRAHPFFSAFNNSNLMDSSRGSDEAKKLNIRAEVLAGGIPALSNPTGANKVDLFGDGQNYDLNSSDPRLGFQTSWPQARLNSSRLNNRWLHSDFEEIAYPFVHKLYETIVNLEN